MSNTELSKHYIHMQPVQGQLPTSAPANIIHALETYCNGKWAWEIADESFALDNTVVCTTVTLYIPGKVLTGRSISPCKDYDQNHLRALVNACQTIMALEKSSQNAEKPPQAQGNMTPNEIMGMINGGATGHQEPPKQASTPPEQNKQEDDYSDLPFYFGSEEAPPENNAQSQQSTPQSNVLNLFDGIDDTPVVPPQAHQEPQNEEPGQEYPPDYDVPKPHLNGFTQRQVDGVNAFKAKFDVVNDTMFNNYINVWNNNFTSKAQLTPQNVDDFLKWASHLGEGVR